MAIKTIRESLQAIKSSKASKVISLRLDVDDILAIELIAKSMDTNFTTLSKLIIKDFISNSYEVSLTKKELINFKSKTTEQKNGKLGVGNVVTKAKDKIRFICSIYKGSQNNFPLKWIFNDCHTSSEDDIKELEIAYSNYRKAIEEECEKKRLIDDKRMEKEWEEHNKMIEKELKKGKWKKGEFKFSSMI